MAIWDDIGNGIKSFFGFNNDDEERRKRQQASQPQKSSNNSFNTSNSSFKSGNLTNVNTGFVQDNSAQIEAENERKRQEEERRRKAEEERKRQEDERRKAEAAKKQAEAARLTQIKSQQGQNVLGANNTNVLGGTQIKSLNAANQNQLNQQRVEQIKIQQREKDLQNQANRFGSNEVSNDREKALREQTKRIYDEKLANEQRQASFLDKTFGQDQMKKRAYDVARSQAIAQQAEKLNYEDQETTNALHRGVSLERQKAQREAKQAQEDLKLENIAKNGLYHGASILGSGAKGAVGAVAGFVPKTAEGLTSGVANTIKFFDEDNQLANNLLKNIQKDRENNQVREFVDDKTKKTNQDNQLAYDLTGGATNLAIDSGLAIGTGGTGLVPGLLHGVSTHQETMENLENIEARKKAEAEARGEEYTSSNFKDRYLASTVNAGAQAALEKAGVEKVLSPMKGLNKNLGGKMLSGFLSEGGEEGAQQLIDNATKRAFDDKQDLTEGVAESALLGGILGAAGAGVYGKADNENEKQNSYNPQELERLERRATQENQFNRNNAKLPIADAEANYGAVERLANGLENGTKSDIDFIRMRPELLNEVNQIRQAKGYEPFTTNQVTAYAGAVNNHLNNRVNEGMDPSTVAHISANSFLNPESVALPSKHDHIQMTSAPNNGRYNTSTISQAPDGGISLKNITTRNSSEIKDPSRQRQEIFDSQEGVPNVDPSSPANRSSGGGGTIPARQANYGSNIAQNLEKVNPDSTEKFRSRTEYLSGNDSELANIAQDPDLIDSFKRRGYKTVVGNSNVLDLNSNQIMDRYAPVETLSHRMTNYNFDTSNPVYHGTNAQIASQIEQNGLKKGSELPADAYRGGGHGEIQDSVSLTPNQKVAENFAMNNPSGQRAIIETNIDNDTKVVLLKDVDYAEDLNPYVNELRENGVDAVWLAGEDELAVINPEKISRDYKIERFRDANGAERLRISRGDMPAISEKIQNEIQKQNKQMFGEDAADVDFMDQIKNNENQDALGSTLISEGQESKIRLALKQGDPEATFLHESIHKALNDYLTPEQRTEVLTDYISKVDNNISDENKLNQAEEQMSEDFIQYVAAKNNSNISKPAIPERISGFFERIFAGIKNKITGKNFTNDYKLFYDDLVGGKFAEREKVGIVKGLKNNPLQGNNALTKGNLYAQTELGSQDITSKNFKDADHEWEYRYHKKKDKDGKVFNSFERRYIGSPDEIAGDWQPYSRAAYTWYTQKGKIDGVNNQQIIQEALAQAHQDGEVRDYVASIDDTGNVKLDEMRGDLSIDGGIVRNPASGNVVGNHIQVTPFGVVNQVNGKMEVYDNELLDGFNQNKSNASDTFMRATEKNSSTNEAEKAGKDLYYEKTVVSDNYINELNELNSLHQKIASEVDKSRPRGVSEKVFWEDVGRYNENIFSTDKKFAKEEAFADKYGAEAASAVKKYDDFMRETYNKVISEANLVKQAYGKDQIEYHKNYMPHIFEDGKITGISGLLPVNWQTGVHGEINQGGRGEIPAHMVGRSENTKPDKKFNVFEKRRKGAKDYVKDPRIAFEKYVENTLYNKHFEPLIAKGRSLESAMRASSLIADNNDKNGGKIKRLRGDNEVSEGGISPRMTLAVTDFVNEIAGKSNAIDRPLTDRANKAMRFLQKFESINGANKIAGNISSTFAQVLNLPETVRDNGLWNTGKSLLTAFDKEAKAAMEKSPFLQERYTDSGAKFSKKKGQKASEFVSKMSGMDAVESAFIRLNWGANYQRLRSEGMNGFQLMKATDQATERAVGGRGIGAMPQIYKSTLGKAFLQFTYETNESWKNNIEHGKGIVKNLKAGDVKTSANMTKRAAESFVVGMALNALFKAVTGNEPLPDLIGAIKDSAEYAANYDGDDEEQKNPWAYGMAQVGGEIAKANPFTSAGLNMIPKAQREEIFGTENDFGRFDGATGVAQIGGNIIGLASDGLTGNGENAKKNALGLVPGGSQIKKTSGAVSSLMKGYSSTGSGDGEKIKHEVDNKNPLKWLQGIAFGENAFSERQEYYEKGGNKSNSNSQLLKSIKEANGENSTQYSSLKQALDRQNNMKDKDEYKESFAKFNDDTTIKLAKGELTQSEDGFIRNKDGEIDRNFYKNYSKFIEDEKGSDNYYLAKKAAMTLNDNLSNEDVDILVKKSEMGGNKDDAGTSEWAKYIYGEEGKSAEYKLMLANYNNKKLNNDLTAKEQIEMPKKLETARVQSDFNKHTRDGYSLTGNYDNTQSYLNLQETDEAKEGMRSKLNQVNDKMLEAGLISQKTYNSKYKNINGISSGGSGSGGKKGRKSSGGSSGNSSFTVPNLPEFNMKAPKKYKNTSNKGKGIVKGIKVNSAGKVEVKALPRVRVNQ